MRWEELSSKKATHKSQIPLYKAQKEFFFCFDARASQLMQRRKSLIRYYIQKFGRIRSALGEGTVQKGRKNHISRHHPPRRLRYRQCSIRFLMWCESERTKETKKSKAELDGRTGVITRKNGW